MAYIPYTYAPTAEGKRKKVRYTLPTGGVKLCNNDAAVEAGKCANISNMDIIHDRISSSRTATNLSVKSYYNGNFNGLCKQPFGGKVFFHIGARLYSHDPLNSESTLISNTLPDKKSLICHFLSKLYIYCDTHVYSLDSEFNFKEEDQDIFAPLIYDSIYASSGASAKKTDAPFNLAAPRITVIFKTSTTKNFTLPQLLDTGRKVEIYKDDVLVDAEDYELREDKIIMNDVTTTSNSRSIKVVYFLLKPEEAGFYDFVGGCSLATAFGGNAGGGTRLFFTGNSEKKGYYYKSELQNPLHIREDEYEIIGDGCENVTALKKMYGDLVIFTDNSVFRMSYNFSSDNTYFSVKELSCEVGCDCPDSVQLIDNRVVFMNSKKGVFIMDSTEDTGEQNIKPISGNILRGEGFGLLENTQENLISACSCDYDRKYMLFVGNKAYIWDYDVTPFRESASYGAAQGRLCWYIYDGVAGGRCVNVDGNLVGFGLSDRVYLYTYAGGAQKSTRSVLDSGMSECFYPLVRKHVTGMSIKLKRDEGCEINLSLYGDGEKYYEIKLPERKNEKEKLLLHLPKKSLYGFGFCINAVGGYEIEEIVAEYIEITE